VRRRQSSTRRQAPPNTPEPPARESPRAKRRFGQNFLVDPSAIARIVEALDPRATDTVVEIGPGRGALTEALLARGIPVVAIEIDRDLAASLRSHAGDRPLRVIEADILSVPLSSLGRRLTIAGNLPYNISKPVAMKLIEERACVARAVLMFQREVALRLTARPATGDYGPLGILAGEVYTIERLFDVPPGAFRPRPKVVSTVTRWTPRAAGELPDALVPALKEILRASFAHRRQTLQKNLRAELPGGEAEAKHLLAAAEIDGSLRAEALPPESFVRMASILGGRTI
jgi:16S rRNA (adenine1518-N6/adenine1519-N6)-dimethyltransferase